MGRAFRVDLSSTAPPHALEAYLGYAAVRTEADIKQRKEISVRLKLPLESLLVA